MSTINERVRVIIDELYGGSQRAFADAIGTSSSVVNGIVGKRQSAPSFELTQKISTIASVSPDWLLLGYGDMMRLDIQQAATVTAIHKPKYTERIEEEQYIPLYSLEATAGVLQQLDLLPEYEIGKIHIPNMPSCDGALNVTGDSMYPLVKSGDIVAYKIIHDIQNIHYGDMYLISINEDGDIYITVKWVHKHKSDPNKVTLVSNNEHYSPRDVEIRHIQHIALIKFTIRYNNMG